MIFWIRKKWISIVLLFKSGVLSDKEIKKFLGYHLYIYPFKKENLGPASYNLTASSCAFIEEDGKRKLIIKGNKIIFPAKKTALIRTEESMYITNKFTGTYHSKVSLVNKGLSHIGTTLDPGYVGSSKIAIYNTTDKDIEIEIGDTIATVIFYVLKGKSTETHNNFSERGDELKFDIKDFYEFESQEKNKKSLTCYLEVFMDTIRKKDNAISLEVFEDNEKERQAILDNIKQWQKQPWIFSKQVLIEKVEMQVKKEATNKDIFIYSILILIITILVGIFVTKPTNLKSFSTEIGSIVNLSEFAAILIGVMVIYKQNKKWC